MLGARLFGAVQKQGHKGVVALIRGGAVGILILSGAGLVGAALVMALAIWIGTIWACLALGVVLLGCAAALITLPKEMPPPPPPLEEIIFALAFIAARRFLRRAP